MRVVVKDMSGAFVHSITPRKARLLLKDKRAVIDSKVPFTIRLLYPLCDCELKESNSSKLNISSKGDIAMLKEQENNIVKHPRNPRTHLIYGSYGAGKTTIFNQIIDYKINHGFDVGIICSKGYSATYYRDTKESNNENLHIFNTCDLVNKTVSSPEEVAKYIVNYYISHIGRCKANTLAIDDFNWSSISLDYTNEEYFRELSKACKVQNLNFLYVTGCSMDKEHLSLPPVYERFSDIITIFK